MDICIIYYSKYGNGKKLVEYLGTILADKGHEVKIFSINEIQPPALPSVDLYVFSSPTHIGGPPGKIKKFLKKVESGREGGKYALITTTMDAKGKTLEKMENLLSGKGITMISEGISVIVKGIKGPLEEGYQEKLDTFANTVIERLSAE